MLGDAPADENSDAAPATGAGPEATPAEPNEAAVAAQGEPAHPWAGKLGKNSQASYNLKRLNAVVEKIGEADRQYERVDSERRAVLGEIAQLRKREYGLSMMARDVKVDLTRFATKQKVLVNELDVGVAPGISHPTVAMPQEEEERGEEGEAPGSGQGEMPETEAKAVPEGETGEGSGEGSGESENAETKAEETKEEGEAAALG